MDAGPTAAIAIGLAMIYLGLLGGVAAGFAWLRRHEPPDEHTTERPAEPTTHRKAA